MAMISNVDYVLHAVRLSALRTTDDSITPRIITLDPTFGANPYISTMGLGDIDSWPEIKRALDSPPPEAAPLPSPISDKDDMPGRRRHGPGAGLRYTQTIAPAGRAGAGMRVSGREDGANIRARRALRPQIQRASSSSTEVPGAQQPPAGDQQDLFSPVVPLGRRRSGSEPPVLASAPVHSSTLEPAQFQPATVAPSALAVSVDSDGVRDDDGALSPASAGMRLPSALATAYEETSSMGIAESAMPSDLAMTVGDNDPLAEGAVDEGSDVDEDEAADEDVAPAPPIAPPVRPGHMRQISHHLQRGAYNRVSIIHEEERRSSADSNAEEPLEFKRMPVLGTPASRRPPGSGQQVSSLTALLNQHVPHLVSTGDGASPPEPAGPANPFASLYATVAAPPTVPSLALEIFFPDSDDPSEPIDVSVRKDATVEEVTGHGLWKYWEEGRTPMIDKEAELSTIAWGLRIVEDDGEVDEDFPPLDRESQVSKFSYGQFGIVRASESQRKQNAAMAPHIVRRPSRIIAAPPGQTRPAPAAKLPIVGSPTSFIDGTEGGTMRSGLASSGGSAAVLLRVLVRASADMTFTTTISVPYDTYIADLTEVLVQKKHLQQPTSEWVLCLADLSLALPLDRTVASLEGQTDLTLVRRQWASEHGLRGDMRGGDPSASIFKRTSEPIPLGFGRAAGDFSQTYKKFTVMRKTPIGRHERQLTIDGDYIRILPSENRAFFDTMKSTSIPVALVANCKLSGRAGGFKIYVWRDNSRKRYEFEADNGKQATEIVACIKQL